MVLLAIFPHPDDECFGPAPALARLRREGHEVHLLTLTRGEATKERHKFGFSLSEMGDQRHRELACASQTLGLTSLDVLALPDGQFATLDPRLVEDAVRAAIDRTRPHALLTYPVHGVSGHPDHLVTHAAVKRVFVEARTNGNTRLQRLLLFGLHPDDSPGRQPHLRATPPEHFGGCLAVTEADLELSRQALACYTTYADVVAAHNPLEQVRTGLWFEVFGEPAAPHRAHFFEGLQG